MAGASVRAAIQSAQRAGWRRLIAADLFQDRDLGAAARCRLDDGYGNLPREAVRLQADAWMYCGALENRPTLVEQVPVPLLGCDAETLRAIRDPWQVAAALQAAQLSTLELASTAEGLPRDGTWICKPLASASGRGVAVLGQDGPPRTSEPVYYQRRIDGTPASAVFVAAEGRCQLLGTTRILAGRAEPGDGGFRYLGSMGAEPLEADQQLAWQRIGRAIAQRFLPRGLFGVDAMVTPREIFPLEVNPRFTASVEVLERAQGWNAWSLHYEACDNGNLSEAPPRTKNGMAAKRILFAERDVWVGQAFLEWAEAQNRGHHWPRVADLPSEPITMPQGAPVVTLLAGPLPVDNWAALTAELARRFDAARHVLYGPDHAAHPSLTSS
jgi:predicted ATP-grasp superfamily ATP-dependent carboligase